MPKQTAKYKSASQLANDLGIPESEHQENLYVQLNAQGYYWNPDKKKWENLNQDAEPPTELIRVRLWADSRFIESVAADCIEAFSKKGLRCVEKSELFTCRPPKQLESRIYLSFVKEPEKTDSPQSTDVVLGVKHGHSQTHTND